MNLEHLIPLQKWLKDECNLSYATSELFNLKELDLSFKKIKLIHQDINLLTNLQRLDCDKNQLTSLELKSPNLQKLFCSSNQLIKIELNCPNLQRLSCNNNRLTKLELNCPKLKELYCYNKVVADLLISLYQDV